jgi:hypothetical protein
VIFAKMIETKWVDVVAPYWLLALTIVSSWLFVLVVHWCLGLRASGWNGFAVRRQNVTPVINAMVARWQGGADHSRPVFTSGRPRLGRSVVIYFRVQASSSHAISHSQSHVGAPITGSSTPTGGIPSS